MPPLHLKCTGGTYLQASASQEGSDENNNIGRNDPAMEAFRETLESTYDRYNQLDAYQLHDDRYSTAHYLRSVADGESIKTDNWLDFCDEECEVSYSVGSKFSDQTLLTLFKLRLPQHLEIPYSIFKCCWFSLLSY